MAVRPTRVRRLRIHRAIQATTFAVSITLVGATWFVASRTHVTLVVGGHAESVSTNSAERPGAPPERGHHPRRERPGGTAVGDGARRRHDRGGESRARRAGRELRLGFDVRVGGRPVNQVPTDVGVWTVEGASSGPAARIAAELAEASASAVDIGTSPVVSVRAVVAGKVHDVLTNARTTGELLSAMGITPGVHDRVRPSSSTPLHVGSTVVVDRVQILTRELRRSIPYATRTLWTTRAPGRSGRPRLARAWRGSRSSRNGSSW